MRDDLNKIVMNPGFEIRMSHPCGICGEVTDLGPARIVPKEDIETHPEFARFRAYRQLQTEGETEVAPNEHHMTHLFFCSRHIEDHQSVQVEEKHQIVEVLKEVSETTLGSVQKEVKKDL
jgi:hypothetical protein